MHIVSAAYLIISAADKMTLKYNGSAQLCQPGTSFVAAFFFSAQYLPS